MASISLKLTRPALSYADGQFISNGWSVKFTSHQAKGQNRIELTTGELLSDIGGTVSFLDYDVIKDHIEDELGRLYYHRAFHDSRFPKRASYGVQIFMKSLERERLIKLVTSGFRLCGINIEVPIETSFPTSAGHMKWDSSSHPKVNIEQYELFFGEPESGTDDDIS